MWKLQRESWAKSEASMTDGCGTTYLPTPATPDLPERGGWRPYQERVGEWMGQCFSPEIIGEARERNHRFLEEALEFVQSTGCTVSEAHQLVDYVFGRPIGDPDQEVGGVMVTLGAACNVFGLSMDDAAERELARINDPAIMAKIRAKQAAKPKHTPLPGPSTPAPAGELEEMRAALEWYADRSNYPQAGPSRHSKINVDEGNRARHALRTHPGATKGGSL